MVKGSWVLGCATRDGDVEAIRATGAFEEPEEWRYPWTARHTTAEWVARLPTHSDHRLLDEATRAALLADVAAVVDARGGVIEMAYEAYVVTAVRRA